MTDKVKQPGMTGITKQIVEPEDDNYPPGLMMTDTIQLEYIGPPNQDWFDEAQQKHTLVAGRRYPVSPAIADYLCESHPTHWKRPDPPKATPAAAKKE